MAMFGGHGHDLRNHDFNLGRSDHDRGHGVITVAAKVVAAQLRCLLQQA